MKKYQYLASWDDQTLTRVGEPVVVLGDSNVSQVEVTLPSDFLLDPTKAECRMYFLLPGEKESAHDVLETAVKDKNGDSHVTWTIKHVHSQKGGRLAFSLTLIGDDAQWDSRTAIIPVYESRYQPESEEAEKPYTGRLDALEGSMAAIRGEFAEVQDDFEELKETATLGTPIPESLVANMTEGHIYVYTGTETGYNAGHVYYYVGGALTDGGVYGGTAVDATLTQSGQAADAKKTGDEISAIKEDLSAKTGLSEEVKQALLACFEKVAWVDEHGQDYCDALEDALYPPATIARITAIYTQSDTVYVADSLDILKPDLVVTAHYTDGTSGIVTDYTLSGTLAESTSTITVSYGGKSATFAVAVTDYTWRYDASDGILLSKMSEIVDASIGNGCTESLVDGYLNLNVPALKTTIIKYDLADATSTNAKLTAKVRFNSLPHIREGAGLRLQLSNGESGVQIFEKLVTNGGSDCKFVVCEGNQLAEKSAIVLGQWYVISVKLVGDRQIVSVDGTDILDSPMLSTYYCTQNRIIVQSAPSTTESGANVDVEWIKFSK